MPTEIDKWAKDEKELNKRTKMYKKVNEMYKAKIEAKEMEPLHGNL